MANDKIAEYYHFHKGSQAGESRHLKFRRSKEMSAASLLCWFLLLENFVLSEIASRSYWCDVRKTSDRMILDSNIFFTAYLTCKSSANTRVCSKSVLNSCEFIQLLTI